MLIHHPSKYHCLTPRAITIGNFDGVHRGHTAILDALVQHAKAHNLTPTVITFDPNPKAFFAAIHNKPIPQRILPLRNKIALFEQHGIKDVVTLHFSQTLANMQPTDFIDKILIQSLNAQYLLIGDDFRFGARRTGDIDLLKKMSNHHGYSIDSLHAIQHNKERISSSIIRTAIASGNLQLTTDLLGHPYTISGHIIYGQQLGRTIGVPTINLKMPNNLAAQGVFAVTIEFDGRTHLGVASIGTRPSVETNGQCWCEAFIFDFNSNAYGKIAHVTLLHKIRNEVKFDGLDALMLAIHKDIDDAKKYLASCSVIPPCNLT